MPVGVEETVESSRQALGGEGQASAAAARLLAVYPPDWEACIDLDDSPVVLGRAPDSTGMPPLVHRTVSRSHLRVEWDAAIDGHVVLDLGSRNGARVDGRRLSTGWAPLSSGSVVRIGDLLLVYERGRTLESPDGPGVDRDAAPGESLPMRSVRNRVARAAPDISPVLVLGETGTGKERLAAEIHRLSGRPGALVAVNCATLSETLIESQLFGHVKGAFTGASSDQQGLFHAAERGTLFLDEIGELPLELQPKLLRALQEREIRPVGASRTKTVDVRVVAATHRNLRERALSGSFRQDLYARLAMWQVELPALRDRRADVLAWLDRLHRAWQRQRQIDHPPLSFSADVAERLVLSPWTENLRGLDRLVHELAADAGARGPRRIEQLPGWVEAEP